MWEEARKNSQVFEAAMEVEEVMVDQCPGSGGGSHEEDLQQEEPEWLVIEKMYQYIIGERRAPKAKGKRGSKKRKNGETTPDRGGFMSAQRRRRPHGWLEVIAMDSMAEFWHDFDRKGLYVPDWLSRSDCRTAGRYVPDVAEQDEGGNSRGMPLRPLPSVDPKSRRAKKEYNRLAGRHRGRIPGSRN